MTPQELQNIIDTFEGENLKKKGLFGIYQQGTSEDSYTYIKANKEGLELFALQLLKVSRQEKAHTTFVEEELEWMNTDSAVWIEGVELVHEVHNTKPVEVPKTTFLEKLALSGILLVALFLAGAMVVGLKTIFTWLF